MSETPLLLLITLLLIPGCIASANIPICNPNAPPPADVTNTVENFLGELVMWDQPVFPINVGIDTEMRNERKQIVREAIDIWNTRTGLTVFTYTEGPRNILPGKVWVNEDELPLGQCGGQIYGLARRYYQTDLLGVLLSIDRGWIRLHTGVPEDQVLGTAIHELGHILGLHHDLELSSIMYRFNQVDRGSITEEDLRYVRDMMSETRLRGMSFSDLL